MLPVHCLRPKGIHIRYFLTIPPNSRKVATMLSKFRDSTLCIWCARSLECGVVGACAYHQTKVDEKKIGWMSIPLLSNARSFM